MNTKQINQSDNPQNKNPISTKIQNYSKYNNKKIQDIDNASKIPKELWYIIYNKDKNTIKKRTVTQSQKIKTHRNTHQPTSSQK
jgi:hypothetical protein